MRGLISMAILSGVLAAPAVARDPIRPAELPPASYAGQQYVDSRGCMFVRAGTDGKVLWVPRVSRQGVPSCDNPPSGKRVPVSEEVGVQPVPDAGATTAKAAASAGAKASAAEAGAAESGTTESGAATGVFFVAVGSFGVAANADRAEARLNALKYRVVRGRIQGASSTLTTVFAGPFSDAATAAGVRDALRGNGFPDATVIGP